MRSISTKLIVAFLSIGVISVAIIFATARWNTRAEFIRFLTDREQTELVTELADYHLEHGRWAGAEQILGAAQPGQAPVGPGPGRRRPPFALANPDGLILIPNEGYRKGERVYHDVLAAGIPISENGELIGILVPVRMPFEGNPREVEFIDRINLTLLYGALIGALIALLLGILLSRTLTRPIRELTRATHAVSEGDLSQQVQVRSDDELGELARTFNRMSAELSRSLETRKQMTADIAHELRTPLSLILGHAEAVHDGVLPPTRENFEIIREEAARLGHIVEDLRTLSLADAGELSISPQPVEPERLVREAASLFHVEARRKDISLEVNIAPGLPEIEVDPGRMTQVITNVLDNAIRHTPGGGRIQISARDVEADLEIAVQDNGPGLPPGEAERIFERFHRTDESRRRADGGSGLGLAIARSIVQAHGGQVWAQAEAGQGLRIVIRLSRSPGRNS